MQYVSEVVGGEGHDDPTRPDPAVPSARVRGDSIYTWASRNAPPKLVVAARRGRHHSSFFGLHMLAHMKRLNVILSRCCGGNDDGWRVLGHGRLCGAALRSSESERAKNRRQARPH